MFKAIREDFRRGGRSLFQRIKEIFFNPAMWALFGYRIRRSIAERLPRPVRWIMAPITIPLQLCLELLTGIQLSTAARIGPGLYLPHLGTIVVGSRSEIGSHCTIAHNVTIGHAGGGTRGGGNPVIGNRVYIGPGAIVIGPITIGDDVLIGAGAVVVKSVTSRGVVAGNPARQLGLAGSFDLIDYPGMETDQARVESLAIARSAKTKDAATNSEGVQ